MELLKNEICKLLTKRAAVFFLLLIAANMLLQIYTMHTPGEDGYSLKDYSGAYRELDSCGRENLLSRLEERAAGADTFGKRNLYDRVYKEVLASLNYAEYLNSIEEKAEEAAILNRISHDDGYAVRNAEITRKVYSKLSGTKPEVEDTMGVLNITDNEITDYLLMVMLFVTAVNLVFREKDGNQFELLRTTQNGRRKLMRSKVFAMSVFVLLGIVSLYGINAVISRCFYAPIDYGSPLQSVPAYRYSPFALTIGSFLVCYFGIKTVSCILLGLLFMWICAVCSNIVFVFSASVAAVFAEILCYTKISGTHFLAFLKYINIQYGVRTGGMFSDYVNLRVWGYPVNTCFLYGIFWLVLITMLFYSVTNYLEMPHEKRKVSLPMGEMRKHFGCHTSLFLHEVYKLLVPGRGFLVLLCSCLLTIWWNPAEKIRFASVDEIYYKEYMDKFYGPLDEKNGNRITEEKEKYEQMYADISADREQGKSENYIRIKYKEGLNRQAAFDLVTEHVDYLRSSEFLQSRTGGWLFYDEGYAILTDGQNSRNRDVSQAFVYLILLIALTCGIYGVDYANSEKRLLQTTYLGRRELQNKKRVLGILCTWIAFVIVYMVRLCNVLGAYGTRGLFASAACMEHLSRIPKNITVLQYICLIMFIRLIGGLLVTGTVRVLFIRLQSSISVISCMIVIFLIPLALAAGGIPHARYILCNPLFLGNVFSY